METWHRYGLLGYFALYFFFGFVWRSILVFRQTGINPIVLPATDDAPARLGSAGTGTGLAVGRPGPDGGRLAGRY